MAPSFQPAAPAQTATPVVDLAASARSGANPVEVLQGARAQRSELRNQVDRLEDKRNDLTRELNNAQTPSSTKPGLEARIKEIDARISATEQQVATADLAVAQAAAVPGATTEPPRPIRNGPPEEVFAIPIVFTIFVLAPIAIAYARRIWKRGATVIAPIPQDVRNRLDQLGDARLEAGRTQLTDCLADLGAPLWVWEHLEGGRDGAALAYGWFDEEDIGVSVSVPLGEHSSASFDYTTLDTRLHGLVLFFDERWVLTSFRTGLLSDLTNEARRPPTALEEDA